MATYSTGTIFGDGYQASHWKDDLGIGIMDPTAAPPGEIMIVTDLDIMAWDVIGWDTEVETRSGAGAGTRSSFCGRSGIDFR